MSNKDRALLRLFKALLELHDAQELDGFNYPVTEGLPEEDIEMIDAYARKNGASAGAFCAALRDLLRVNDGLTTDEIQKLLNGRGK